MTTRAGSHDDPRLRADLGRLLSRVENEGAAPPTAPPSAPPLRLIGITGPPGVGKSTLVSKLAQARAATGAHVGIVAVDPTSPFSGGALLGDRIRMNDLEDDRIFIRSLASRGETGGLAPAALRVAQTLAASGYPEVYLETVGAGQTEVEIARIADTRVVVLSAGSGDAVQALKAGLLEIADVFVVNKDDEPGADGAAAALELAVRERAWKPPILRASARAGTGIEEILDALAGHADHLARSEEGETRLAARRGFAFTHALRGERIRALERSTLVRRAAESAEAGRVDPYAAAAALGSVSFGHAALVTKAPERLLAILSALGLAVSEREEVPAEGVRVSFVPLSEGAIEILEPTDPTGAISKWREKRGGGIHHVTLEVSDFDAALGALRAAGTRLAGEPRAGAQSRRVLFVHPEATGGILIEIVSRA